MSSDRGGGNTTYVEKGGSGLGGILIGLAVLIVVAVIAFVFLQQNRNDQIRTDAVTSAAGSVADSAQDAAQSVGQAADRVAPPAVPAQR